MFCSLFVIFHLLPDGQDILCRRLSHGGGGRSHNSTGKTHPVFCSLFVIVKIVISYQKGKIAMDDKFRQQLEECGADVETTLKRFMGNDAIYQKFLGKFPNDPNYANLGTNLEAGAFEEAYNKAFYHIFRKLSAFPI